MNSLRMKTDIDTGWVPFRVQQLYIIGFLPAMPVVHEYERG